MTSQKHDGLTPAEYEVVEKKINDIIDEKKESFHEAGEDFLRLFPSFSRESVMKVADNLLKESRDAKKCPRTVKDPGAYPNGLWVPKRADGPLWNRYRKMLEEKHAPGLEELDRSTREIVSHLAPIPAENQSERKRKGLVMGQVQSGKTRNYAGVIARAVDAGYRFVIVLTGMHRSLRDQTQNRLDHDLFVDKTFWYAMTHPNEDVNFNPNLPSLAVQGNIFYAVVKKNIKRLQNLVSSFKEIKLEPRKKLPILIIDDEADQATPNSARGRDEVSAVNREIRRLWGLVEAGTYLAYTATPFANVLMNPDDEDDLFPSDFIQILEPGEGYLGAEQVFGLDEEPSEQSEQARDGLDMVRVVPEAEAESLRPPSSRDDRESFDPDIPPSMVAAVEWFVVATAIRRSRAQTDHSSMLVHTTHYADPHFAMKKKLDVLVAQMRDEFMEGRSDRFKQSFDRENGKVLNSDGTAIATWETVQEELGDVLESVRVIVDNGSSNDRLNYDDDSPQTVIAVGGGTLSRGLTLEGLVVSYFTRTSNSYDTLLQMGRWFGYRTGYEDLPRIWVADGLDRDYAFLASVESDLRDEIKSVASSEFTPRQVGVKIRRHPGRLEITGATKMSNAQLVDVSLSGIQQQAFILDGRQEAAVNNRRVVETLLDGAVLEPVPHRPEQYIAHDVTTDRIRQFLRNFSFSDRQRAFVKEDTRTATDKWLREFASEAKWNVVLAGRSRANNTMHICGVDLGLLDRAPLGDSEVGALNFKAMMNPGDLLSDIDLKKHGVETPKDRAGRKRVRREYGEGAGLLVIYPLDPKAKHKDTDQRVGPLVRAGSSRRVDMPDGVANDLLGFGIVYPTTHAGINENDHEYVSVRPMDEPVMEDDFDEDEFAGMED